MTNASDTLPKIRRGSVHFKVDDPLVFQRFRHVPTGHAPGNALHAGLFTRILPRED